MRESLADQLVRVARDLGAEPDPSHVLDRVTGIAADWSQASAGISLLRRRGRLESVAATDELVVAGDELQYELQEGPCLDAARHSDADQLVTGDLAHDGRWPRWGPKVARDLDVSSMLCTRLFTNEQSIGALNLYSTRPDAFDKDLCDEVTLLAAHAAIAVAASLKVEQLSGAVDRRTTIGTAVGIVMERFSVDRDRAFQVLVRLSSHQNRKIFDLAQELVETGHLPA